MGAQEPSAAGHEARRHRTSFRAACATRETGRARAFFQPSRPGRTGRTRPAPPVPSSTPILRRPWPRRCGRSGIDLLALCAIDVRGGDEVIFPAHPQRHRGGPRARARYTAPGGRGPGDAPDHRGRGWSARSSRGPAGWPVVDTSRAEGGGLPRRQPPGTVRLRHPNARSKPLNGRAYESLAEHRTPTLRPPRSESSPREGGTLGASPSYGRSCSGT
jgi:hypothetical protein